MTHSDHHPQALAEELARRLGRDRCWRVRWPSEAAAASEDGAEQGGTSAARKDANEVLLKDGPEALQALMQEADPYPIRGLFKYAAALLSALSASLAVEGCSGVYIAEQSRVWFDSCFFQVL